jgi:DnaJ-class molecular chaperone
MRWIIKYCQRCGGAKVVARRGSPIKYVTCPRCSGSGGKTEQR